MFHRYLRAFSTGLPMMPFLAPDDGAGGGGAAGGDSGAPAGGDAGMDTSDGGDVPDARGDEGGLETRGDRGTDDDDLTDEEREQEELLATLSPEERAKRVRTWNRRASRRLRAVAPIAEMFRDARTGQYRSPDDIRRLVNDAEDMAELNQLFGQHPDLVQEVLKRRNGGGRATADATPKTFQDPYANEDALPFDMEQPASRYLVDQLRAGARERFELQQTLAQITERLQQLSTGDQRRTLATIEDTWKTSTLAAAKQAGLQGDDLQLFVNGVWKTFELGKAQRRLGRMNLQDVITRELAPFRGRRRASAADTSRRAAAATHAPRPGGGGQRTAANPSDSNRPGTIRDARKSFFDRIGQSAPPR